MELDDAYANAAYIPNGAAYPERWARAATRFRDTTQCEIDLPYGKTARQRFDLFHPPQTPEGLVVFIHGGYWRQFDKSFWSHLAAGPLAHGWAVAIPSYDLCPDVRIADIGDQIGAVITVASTRVPGPIRLVGHSAGAQLVARMTAPRRPIAWQDRLAGVVAISPLADLAPLMQTSMNADLCLDAAEVAVESPVHLPAPAVPVTVWVGGRERPVFLEQAQALADAWQCCHVIAPERHHFDVVADLADADSSLVGAVLG